MKTKGIFIYPLLFLISISSFSQKSKISLEAGAGAGFYANIGVWGLKYNNGIDYQLSNKFSLSGNLGFYQSLIDFQKEENNSLSNMVVDCDLNFKIFETSRSNSLWIGAGITYFNGVEFRQNYLPVVKNIEGLYINGMGFNYKIKYKHPLGNRLLGSVNAEIYSREVLFNANNLLVNLGYSVICPF